MGSNPTSPRLTITHERPLRRKAVAARNHFVAYYVYVLRSDKTGRRYIGSCDDPIRRLADHNARNTPSTRAGVPWRIVYTETVATRAQALERERALKSGQGRAHLDRLGL